MSIFTGAATALITPFTNDDKVDFDALEKLLDFQLKGGINALVVNGTTGEPNTMTHTERNSVIKFVIEKIDKRIPIIVGTGSNNTHTAIMYSEEAEEFGADAVLIVTPYYNKGTQNGLVAHYKAIADKINIPIIVYNVPSRTGINLLPETMAKLAGYKNIAAIKEASGNFRQMMDVVRLCGDKIDVYSGEDSLTYPCLAVGGKGIISVTSNIVPEYMANITKEFFNGNIEKSRNMQLKIIDLMDSLFCEVNPIPIKTAAYLMGMCSDYKRLPLTKMEKIDRLKKSMQDFGIEIKE